MKWLNVSDSETFPDWSGGSSSHALFRGLLRRLVCDSCFPRFSDMVLGLLGISIRKTSWIGSLGRLVSRFAHSDIERWLTMERSYVTGYGSYWFFLRSRSSN